ncbi:uncharacterized protein LOC135094325 isoform X2 [Scylla paramamosain]|uniref:uncharacterized protein LOC135094325 isoform X2 n=1 Tax=Scylla paramamosain TaxID=85552 RepID=UPI0030836571
MLIRSSRCLKYMGGRVSTPHPTPFSCIETHGFLVPSLSCRNEALHTEKHVSIRSPKVETNPEWNGTIVVRVERVSAQQARFTWDVTPEVPEGVNIYVRYERHYPSCAEQDNVGEWKIKRLNDSILRYLYPYTNTKVTVQVGDVEGSNNITSAARLPRRKVKGMTCSAWSCEAAVDPDCRNDNGPDFHVEFVLETWNEDLGSYSPVSTVDKEITENFTAKIWWEDLDLLPLTSYSLTAYPANSKGRIENKVNPKETFTTPDALPKVTNLVIKRLEEENQMHFSWKPSRPSSPEQYFVSLCQVNCEEKPVTTNSTMIFPLDELAVGKKYIVKVRVCITGRQCSGEKEIEMWTPPEKPMVQEKIHTATESTTTTITVQLPVLCNTPGWHHVVMKKSETKHSDAWYKHLQDEAKEIVSQNRDAMQNVSSHSPDKNSPLDTEYRIMKTVQQNNTIGEDGETMKVIVGEESPLQSNTKYTVLIVTETRAGNWSQYYVTGPFFYSTKLEVDPVSATLVIGGICSAAMLLGVLATVVWMKSCNRRDRRIGAILVQRFLS